MSLESGRRRVIGDPVAMRALAHPLRLKLHALVGREGTMTAATAARALRISQALASHHLRQLGKYGFVEQAGRSDNRERPWRVTAVSQDWEPGETAEGHEGLSMLERFVLERSAAQLAEWQQRRPEMDSRWSEHTGVSQNLAYLTVDELAELHRAWEALISLWVQRRPLGDTASRPEGAVPIDITLIIAPLPPTASGG
ncbi:helix-turn-helix domain-containing protein [Micromonospora sp. NPDC049801]|uniref:helix-turn-helix domain-containing protein n=1 Tax=unclassified Micromonospora TaxID=2617518 RepID=UPI0033F7506F